MIFFQFPVFWILFFISSGIVSSSIDEYGVFFKPSLWISSVFIVFLISSYFIRIPVNKMFQSISVLALFFFCGYFLNSFHLTNLGYNSEIKQTNAKFKGVVEECNFSTSGYAKVVFKVNGSEINNEWKPVKSSLFLIINDSTQTIQSGESLVVFTELEKIKTDETPGAFDAKKYWNRKGIKYMGFVQKDNFKKIESERIFWLTNVMNQFRDNLLSALDRDLSGQAAALAKGFLLGDRSDIDSQMLSKFSSTGAMHILAVSGLHIGILVQLLTKLLSLFSRFISKNQAVIFALILVWIYALLTGLSVSVVRSVVMFSILSLSTLTGRRYIDVNCLFFSAVLILLWNPSFLFDVGFQLSYTALFGIFTIYLELVKLITFKNKWLMLAYEGTMVGVAAQITTLPLTLYYFHQFPNYFIVTNLALMAFSFVLLLVGSFLFVFYWLAPVKIFLTFILQKLFLFMIFIVSKISSFPFSVASGFELNWIEVVGLYLAICALVYFYFIKNNRLLNGVLFIVFFQLVGLIYSRYDHLRSEKIFVIPGKQPLSVLRYNSVNYFVYERKTEGTIPNKVKKMAQNFSYIYPGRSEFYNLNNLEKIASLNPLFPLEIINNYDFIQLQLRNRIVRLYKHRKIKNTSNSLNNFKTLYYPLNSLKVISFSLK